MSETPIYDEISKADKVGPLTYSRTWILNELKRQEAASTRLRTELAAAREQRDQAIRAAKAIQVELFKYQDANDISVWCDCDDHGAACARGLYHPPGHVTCRYG